MLLIFRDIPLILILLMLFSLSHASGVGRDGSEQLTSMPCCLTSEWQLRPHSLRLGSGSFLFT